MSKKNIQEELKRKSKFIVFLRNSVFLLLEAISRKDEEDIKEYQEYAIDSIDGILGINSHGELKNKDTREEDVKLNELKNSVRRLEKNIADKYGELPKSVKP